MRIRSPHIAGVVVSLILATTAAAWLLRGGSATSVPSGMVWIAGGEFTMGTNDMKSMPNERPSHRVRLDGYFIDQTPVTNAQFRAFVTATGYVTTAERPVDWEELKKQVPPGTPKPSDEMLSRDHWSSRRQTTRSICGISRNGGPGQAVRHGNIRRVQAAASRARTIIPSCR